MDSAFLAFSKEVTYSFFLRASRAYFRKTSAIPRLYPIASLTKSAFSTYFLILSLWLYNELIPNQESTRPSAYFKESASDNDSRISFLFSS